MDKLYGEIDKKTSDDCIEFNKNIESNKPAKTEEEKAAAIKESTEYYNKNAKPGSLAAKANMVKQYNEKNNK